jgi:hypothetical protein
VARDLIQSWIDADIPIYAGSGLVVHRDIADAIAAAEARGERAGIERAAQIAKDARSEAGLARHKTEGDEEKACWLWAFDTANQIEHDIRSLLPPAAPETK